MHPKDHFEEIGEPDMATKASVFFDNLRGKEIALVGIGVSHTKLIKLLAQKGLDVTVYDRRSREEIGGVCGELEAAGARLELGPKYLKRLRGDIIFRTPGMNYFTPELVEARKAGCIVTSEMEVFFDLCPCKTTSTTLIAEMLRAEGRTVHLGGNIGRALLPEIESVEPTDYAVVELSSFQLISMRQSPDIAVVTNVAPNHLDVHKTMEEYIEAKTNIFLHQNGFSRTVLNADNRITNGFANRVRGQLNLFSRLRAVQQGAWMDQNGVIWHSTNDSQTRLMRAETIRLPRVHNIENYLAAISAVWGLVSKDTMCKVAQEFGGVEHRIEFVRELDGVKWYNDSIATSPTRTIAGLNSFHQKLIIIAGGYDKQIPFEPLAPVILKNVKTLVLTGTTAPKIEAAVTACPGYAESGLRIVHAKDLPDAVEKARAEAAPGDIVSLSPACASFDAYPNFEARGRHFKELVNQLK